MGLTVFISYQYFAVEHLVVPEDVVEHLLVEVFRRGLEGDLHAACFLHFQVDVSTLVNTVHPREEARSSSYGGSRFNRMPTASSSASSSALCSAFFVASRIIRIRSLVYLSSSTNSSTPLSPMKDHTFAAEITCLPLPFPSEAPSMMPGKSRTWISAPPYSSTPGMAVSVVNEYAATSLFVLVIFDKKVDLPTEGKPTNAIRASPLLLTSNPDPPPDPAPGAGSRSWARRRASFLKRINIPLSRCE